MELDRLHKSYNSEIHHQAEQEELDPFVEQADLESQDAVRPWISRWLRPYSILAAVVVTLAIQGTVIGLVVRSIKNNGIASINNDRERKVASIDVGLSLTWTVLPSLFFQSCALLFGAIVTAAYTRQPYVELLKNHSDGAAPEKSILLDYNAWLPPWAMVKALKYGHLMLAWAILVSLIMNSLIAPLTSHLFDSVAILREQAVSISQAAVFNDNGLSPHSDLASVLDVVTATKVYGAQPIPWTTANTSLLPVDLTSLPSQGQTMNISAKTQGYTFDPSCRVLDSSQYMLREDLTDGNWYFGAQDRGCSFGTSETIIYTSALDGTIVSFAETYQISCDNDVGSSRMVVAAALNSKASLKTFSNVSVVSCIPSYLARNGTVGASYGSDLATTLQSFDITSSHAIDSPLFARTFETSICLSRVIDSSGKSLVTKLGGTILQYAAKQAPDAYFDDDVMLLSTQTVLESAFTVMVQRFLIEPTEAREIEGTIFQQQKRVFVVLPIAYSVIGILTAVWLALIWIGSYTSRNRIAQYEESRALIGAAATLCQSTLMAEVDRKKDLIADGRVGSKMAKIFTRRDRHGWKVENWENAKKAVLVSTDRSRPIRWFRS